MTASPALAKKLDVTCSWKDREQREVRFVLRVEPNEQIKSVTFSAYEGKFLPETASTIQDIVFSDYKIDDIIPGSTTALVDWYRDLSKGGLAVASVSGRYVFNDGLGGNFMISVTGILDAKENMVQKSTPFIGQARVITHYQDEQKTLSKMIMTEMTCTNLTDFDLSAIQLGR